MSSVQFLSWRDNLESENYKSYKTRKQASDNRHNQLENAIRDHSAFNSENEINSCVQAIMNGTGMIIPTQDFQKAKQLAHVLEKIGAEFHLRELDDASLCPRCQSFTVILLNTDPDWLKTFRCAKCFEVKRGCSECGNQGWLRHYKSKISELELYCCDECDALWGKDWLLLPDLIHKDFYQQRQECELIVDYLSD